MGFTPREVDRMSVWELQACIDGFSAANGAKDEDEPPDEETYTAIVAQNL